MTDFYTKPACRYFLGDRPCRFKRTCPGCPHFDSPAVRILIIKLAAPGDVLRTAHLLPALKKKYPDSHITWVTDNPVATFLEQLDDVDLVIPWNADLPFVLGGERRFDLAINLDKEPRATGVLAFVPADERLGFLPGAGHGGLIPANRNASYLYRLGLDDELKFNINQKTYQKMIHEVVGLDDPRERYPLRVPAHVKERVARRFGWPVAEAGPDRGGEVVNGSGPGGSGSPADGPRARGHRLDADEIGSRAGAEASDGNGPVVIGLNTGAGSVFANKSWDADRWVELVKVLAGRIDCRFFLLGGPEEKEKNRRILEESGDIVFDTGCNNTMLEFAAVIDGCAVVVTGDTFALHVAAGLGRRVVAFFGPTCASEIELYGKGRLIRSPVECGPCYRRACDVSPTCMDLLTVETVARAVEECVEEALRE